MEMTVSGVKILQWPFQAGNFTGRAGFVPRLHTARREWPKDVE
jgi:hypothetical protein